MTHPDHTPDTARDLAAVTCLQRIALWLVFNGPRLPFDWAPRLMGFALGSKPIKKEDNDGY